MSIEPTVISVTTAKIRYGTAIQPGRASGMIDIGSVTFGTTDATAAPRISRHTAAVMPPNDDPRKTSRDETDRGR